MGSDALALHSGRTPAYRRWLGSIALWLALCTQACSQPFQPDAQGGPNKTVLVHYMPWYAAPPTSDAWGWHWTMGRFNPERLDAAGRREIASHAYPLIGPYDSNDPHVLEYHVLLMKLAGVDGVVIDWYGTSALHDYETIHRSAVHLIEYVKKAGLQFAICYEDRTVQHLAEERGVVRSEAYRFAARDIEWLHDRWFSDAAYVRVDGRPILPVFGPIFFKNAGDWEHILGGLSTRPLLYALPHLAGSTRADGVFGWPPVHGGETIQPEVWVEYLTNLYAMGRDSTEVMAVAFPGFHDIYETSYGYIDARDGSTFDETLARAMDSASPLVQIATWNDHGEGTSIEPTVEFGYRYLEALQRALGVRAYTADDMRLPEQLYTLRKRVAEVPALHGELERASDLLFAGELAQARRQMREVAQRLAKMDGATD